jgi:DNA-binding MarR family transcriptional regulator
MSDFGHTDHREAVNNMKMIHHVNTIFNEISSLYHQAGEKLGLADSEMAVLYLMCDQDKALSQSDIIQMTGMSKQTVNSAVIRMENNGWIRRNDTDTRRKTLLLSPAGQKLVEKLILPFMAEEETIFSSWTQEEKQMYLHLNERYREALQNIVAAMPERKKNQAS